MDNVKRMLGSGSKIPLPQDDVFYGYHTTKDELKKYSPGAVLRTRKVEMKPWFGMEVDKLIVWEIAYVTTGPFGAEVTVCTVVIPPNAGKLNRIVVQCPKTDAASPICRTSFDLRAGQGGATDGAGEQIFMAPFLDRGYIVVLPDYQGQRDSFGCGIISGNSTLDCIRATMACSDFTVAPKDKVQVVVWGYSGGAIAASWAAQSLATYAPDLQGVIVGISMGGTPVDLLSCAISLNAGIGAGLIIAMCQGLANAYPNLQKWLDATLTKEGKAVFETAKTKCFFSYMTESFNKDVLNLVPDSKIVKNTKYFMTDTNPILESTPLKILQENSLSQSFTATKDQKLIPKVPIYIYQAISDYVVPVATVDSLVSTWANNGANIQYDKIKGWLHVGCIFANASENTNWISARFEGKETSSKPGKAYITEGGREIADEESCTSLKNHRAEQMDNYYKTVYEKEKKPWW